jgi:hypothetical protein
LGIVAAVGSFAAALWLLLGFKPDRYADDGMLFPGEQVSQVVPRRLQDQRNVAALAVVGAACRLLALLLGVLS